MAHDDGTSHYHQSSPPTTSWEHIYPHSHHGTPAQEYSGFHFVAPQLHMEPSGFSNSIQQRPVHQQLQPLIMPQWPSMLGNQAHSFQPLYSQPVQPVPPMSMGSVQTPISAVSSRSGSTPRKTLTDHDRRRMCQYAEEHPNSKQTEIGAVFGVERSTVSKVLRQKEKYLAQDEGSKSPVKRAKGRSPDIERALAVWAKNQEKKGMPLTDEIIRDKARAFAATTTSPDNHQVLSSSWIEKFKLKNNLMGARSRKSSLAPDDAEGMSTTTSSSHTPNGVSPVSPPAPRSPSPIDLHSAKSQESLKNESPDSFLDYSRRPGPFHSQSATSLNSAFTDTAPSSFSPGPLSPTSSLFTPDSGTAPSPFMPAPLATARPILPAPPNSNQQRPRSQTFPLLDQFMAATASTDVVTPKYDSASVLDSPMEEASDPLSGIDETMHVSRSDDRPRTIRPAETMRPPPLPAHILNAEGMREATPSRSFSSFRPVTSPEEALQALEVVHSFFEQQPNGFLDFQESVTMGKLMEKLKLQSRSGSISG